MSNSYSDIACIAVAAVAVDIACIAVAAAVGTVGVTFSFQAPDDSKECHHSDRQVQLAAEY